MVHDDRYDRHDDDLTQPARRPEGGPVMIVVTMFVVTVIGASYLLAWLMP